MLFRSPEDCTAGTAGAARDYGFEDRNIEETGIKKNPAKQDSPPAAGRASDLLPFRCSAIRVAHLLSYGNEVSYTIKKGLPPSKPIC